MFKYGQKVVMAKPFADDYYPPVGTKGVVIGSYEVSEHEHWVEVKWDRRQWKGGDERYDETKGRYYLNGWAVPVSCLAYADGRSLLDQKVKEMWERQPFFMKLLELKGIKVKKREVKKVEVEESYVTYGDSHYQDSEESFGQLVELYRRVITERGVV